MLSRPVNWVAATSTVGAVGGSDACQRRCVGSVAAKDIAVDLVYPGRAQSAKLTARSIGLDGT